MTMLVTLVRNPYVLPDISPKEGIWIPRGPVLGDKIVTNDKRWYAKLKPHERLFAHHTLNSIRKDCRLVRSKVPNDSLDLALSSAYSHNADTMVPKMYVSMQPESLGRDTWRCLRNQIKIITEPPVSLDHPIKYGRIRHKDGKNVEAARIHPSSLKLAIEGPHTDQTNPGYSRKIDGTYYGI